MYLLIIGWMYVVLMMAVAEATNSNGTVLGAVVTFVLYGLLPSGLLAYLMGTPARNKRNKKQRAEAELALAQQAGAVTAEPAPLAAASGAASGAAGSSNSPESPNSPKSPDSPTSPTQAAQSVQPNAGSHPASGAMPVAAGTIASVAPVRKET